MMLVPMVVLPFCHVIMIYCYRRIPTYWSTTPLSWLPYVAAFVSFQNCHFTGHMFACICPSYKVKNQPLQPTPHPPLINRLSPPPPIRNNTVAYRYFNYHNYVLQWIFLLTVHNCQCLNECIKLTFITPPPPRPSKSVHINVFSN